MSRISVLWYKSIVIGVIVLFVGASITPIMSVNIKQIKNNEILKNKLEEIVLIVDQALDSQCGNWTGRYQIKAFMPLGQSFIPLYSCHYGIELYIGESNPGSPLAPIQISLRENNITGPIVSGTNVTLNLTSGSGWRFFEFDSPMNLTINQTYFIDISTTTIRWGNRCTDGWCYTRGLYYMEGEPTGYDQYFRTYVLSPYPVANFTYSAEESPVLFNASSSYDQDGEIISYDWNFGDGTNGTGKITSHKYCEVGTYYVTLTVTDDDGLTGNITKCVDVLIADTPPEVVIDGPNRGRPGIEYEFNFIVTDPDDDEIYIMVYWGDNTSTSWMGPYKSGPINISHKWDIQGVFLIYVNLKDSCGETGWSDPFLIEIPRTRASSYLRYEWFLECFSLLEKLLSLLL